MRFRALRSIAVAMALALAAMTGATSASATEWVKLSPLPHYDNNGLPEIEATLNAWLRDDNNIQNYPAASVQLLAKRNSDGTGENSDLLTINSNSAGTSGTWHYDGPGTPNLYVLHYGKTEAQTYGTYLSIPGTRVNFAFSGLDSAAWTTDGKHAWSYISVYSLAAPIPAALPLAGMAFASLGGLSWLQRRRQGKLVSA